MGANIALLRNLYDVYFDWKLRINEQSICKMYKLPNESEQDTTVGVMRDLLNCRDGIYDIAYFNYDDITVIIDELCMCYIIYVVFIFALYCVLLCYYCVFRMFYCTPCTK